MRLIRFSLVALLCAALLPQLSAASSIPVSVTVSAVALDSVPPPPSIDTLRYVHRIFTHPESPNTGQPTTLILEGEFPYPCGEVFGAYVLDPEHVTLGLRDRTFCRDTTGLWHQPFELGLLPEGPHRVQIELIVINDPAGSQIRTLYRGSFEFKVARSDSAPPRPTPGPLPYVDEIRVVPKPNMLPIERPICPGDSIAVFVRGMFPSDCFSLKRIELFGSDIAGPQPEPPTMRIVVDDGACLGRPCIARPVPWFGWVTFGPLPAREYQLRVQLAQVSCSDSVSKLHTTLVPFAVVDSCPGPPVGCLVANFEHPSGLGACDAVVSPQHPAFAALDVHSPVALSGIQGELRLYPPVLRITQIEPIGPAVGMHLSWGHTPEGARFVLFAERGSPIPPSPFPPDSAGVPILRVTVGQPPGSRAPMESHLSPEVLLGSDIDGHGVPMCMFRDVRIIDIFSARICAGNDCDFNRDGLIDIRDIVLMVHCVPGEGPCPDSVARFFDCNHDSLFTLDDVLCCARRILRETACPDCPPDTSVTRPEPGVKLSLGVPVGGASGVDVPIRLEGASRIGGARLALSFPAERFSVGSVDFPTGGSEWLELHEIRDGQVIIGMIRTGPITTGLPDVADLVLHLALKPGQTAGGAIAGVDGDFSGPDGVKLQVDLGHPSQSLGGSPGIELSENHPEPFTGETRFSLTLGVPAEVEVGIYDVSGRLVTSLFKGHLGAGLREFVWSGTNADGSAARSGIYFYRVVTPMQP